MDREINSTVIIFQPYVIDDGWNLPAEVVEEIEYKVKESCKAAYHRVCKEHEEHSPHLGISLIMERRRIMPFKQEKRLTP